VISLGALDNFKLNLGADSTDLQRYILGNIPTNNQWNYTVERSYKALWQKTIFITAVASRNMLNNESDKIF
jgi:hypothetical protein